MMPHVLGGLGGCRHGSFNINKQAAPESVVRVAGRRLWWKMEHTADLLTYPLNFGLYELLGSQQDLSGTL